MGTRMRAATSGRPSKGDRDVMTTRLPRQLADLIRQRAEDNDLSYSEEIANAVAATFGQAPVAVGRPQRQQDQMPLIA